MIILAEIWDKWATMQSLAAAAKKVRITNTSLNVGYMQQDKFAIAENCIQSGEAPPVTPDMLNIVSPDKRKGSAKYYKRKYEQAQKIIEDLSERSIQLEEVPGLLTIKKAKPTLEKSSVRVTQVHGSMRVKDVVSKVREIKEEKQKKLAAKELAVKKKEETTERFIRCKEVCSCKQAKCAATGLKQCPVCKNVLKSLCSKATCKVDGVKPTMILPAGKEVCKSGRRKKLFEELDEEEEDATDEEAESEEEDSQDEKEDGEEEEESITNEDYEIGESSKSTSPTKIPLTKIPLSKVEIDDWVKVKYEGELFIGRVIPGQKDDGSKQIKKHVRVRCLNLPYGIHEPQDFERENDAVDYTEVYECTEKPVGVQVERAFKWLY